MRCVLFRIARLVKQKMCVEKINTPHIILLKIKRTSKNRNSYTHIHLNFSSFNLINDAYDNTNKQM